MVRVCQVVLIAQFLGPLRVQPFSQLERRLGQLHPPLHVTYHLRVDATILVQMGQ